MPNKVRLWSVTGNQLTPILSSALDFEERLEEWLMHDISLVSEEFLVISRQWFTPQGRPADLIAMDENGDLILLELKRDRSDREIVAQTLDYASSMQDMDAEEVKQVAETFFHQYLQSDQTLEDAFEAKFGIELPEVLNESHRLYIVVSSVDSSTERIIKYLSETHGVNINVVTFEHFSHNGQEMIGQTVLLDVNEVKQRSARHSKRSSKTWSRTEIHKWIQLQESSGNVEQIQVFKKLFLYAEKTGGLSATGRGVVDPGFVMRIKNDDGTAFPAWRIRSVSGVDGLQDFFVPLSKYPSGSSEIDTAIRMLTELADTLDVEVSESEEIKIDLPDLNLDHCSVIVEATDNALKGTISK